MENEGVESLKELLAWGKSRLKDGGLDSYALDAEVLLMEACGLDRTTLYVHGENCPDTEKARLFRDFIKKRLNFMPVQYITGQCEFYGRNFRIGPGVLIPRGDTEILVEKILEAIKTGEFANGLEIGVGSGCISVTLLCENKGLNMTAVDISKPCLETAEKNARLNGVSPRLMLIESDLFGSVKGTFDFIVSNPPYIPVGEIETLDRNVKDYEPLAALSGGRDGLCFYRSLSREAKGFIRPGAMVFYEIGYNQYNSVSHILKQEGYGNIHLFKDLAGRDRVVTAVFPGFI